MFVRETRGHARHESADGDADGASLSTAEVFKRTSFTEPALSSVRQAGLVNNLNDGLAWGLFPLVFAAHEVQVDDVEAAVARLWQCDGRAGELNHRQRREKPGEYLHARLRRAPRRR